VSPSERRERFWRWWYLRVHKVNVVQLLCLQRLLQSRREYFEKPAHDFMRRNFDAPLHGVPIGPLRCRLDRAFTRLGR